MLSPSFVYPPLLSSHFGSIQAKIIKIFKLKMSFDVSEHISLSNMSTANAQKNADAYACDIFVIHSFRDPVSARNMHGCY